MLKGDISYKKPNKNVSERDIRRILLKDFGIKVSNKWINKYLFLFDRCRYGIDPVGKVKIVEYCYYNTELFAMFIHGCRAHYYEMKLPQKPEISRSND